jgi:acetylornithine deacetylase
VSGQGASPVVSLLDTLVRARSPSREEQPAADALEAWLRANAPGDVVRSDRNVAIVRDSGVPGPTLLLLSHHDTVPATAAWTRDPWDPAIHDGRMYGLGANDAKGCLSAMCVAFASARVTRGRLVLAGVCEEEIGRGGAEVFLPTLPAADEAIVGEPTGLDVAVAQNGLLILECETTGRAGHAARPHLADNAIYAGARDVLALEALTLDRVHPIAGATTHAVTVCSAGERHNVIPDRFRFTIDLRTTAAYTHDTLVELVRGAVSARTSVSVRSGRFRPVATPDDAPILAAALRAVPQARTFSSPTLSDWAHLDGPAIKWGPGLSEVSHTADEWVELAMVERAVVAYRQVIEERTGAA